MFTEKIWVEKDFQTSVNIAYDLHNENKIKNFIPTISAIEIIEDGLLSTSATNTSRAKILIGAYGKGKSHIVLMIAALLSQKNMDLFTQLLNKIQLVNPPLHQFIVRYIQSDTKLLPIIISGNSTSITQSFLLALQNTLKKEELLDLMPDTNFKSAIHTIHLWESKYPRTYQKFKESIKVSIQEFIGLLESYDVKAYHTFRKIYPDLTSGSQFDAFLGVDVLELYESVTKKLIEYGYSGIYIIYDEFSKYLESSIASATISDTKLLQDFAEKCDRSGEKQMHLMLISHKDISNYIDSKLQKSKVDGWRGVSGRYKNIKLESDFSQFNEVISQVIRKDSDFWEEYKKQNKQIFQDLFETYFLEKDAVRIQEVVEGCYPLHPISTFILPRISEKVAQNERTLFTFLSSTHKNTLSHFLLTPQEGFPLLTPDYIYDYFAPLLKEEPYSSPIYDLYQITERVLHKLEESILGLKIIKTLALFYIINQFEKLPPTTNSIFNVFYSTPQSLLEETIQELVKKECVLYPQRNNNYLQIKENIDTNVQGCIDDMIEKNKYKFDIAVALNDIVVENYIYPIGYNDEMQMIRYFNFEFISGSTFLKIMDWKNILKSSQSAGTFYAIIPQSQLEIEQINQHMLSEICMDKHILFAVPEVYVDIQNMTEEYVAVQELANKVLDDTVLLNEYQIYLDDLGKVISKYSQSFMRPELNDICYFHCGEKQMFKRKSQISAKLSEICYELYPYTPKINNENINKNILNAGAIQSRNKIVQALLKPDLESNLGFVGSGQEVSFMRSTLIVTQILVGENDGLSPSITFDTPDEHMSKLLLEIRNFFVVSANQKEMNFQELYEILISNQYGYGLKKGVIPIYLAVILHQLKQSVIIKHKGVQIKITADVLNDINEFPEDFTVILEDITSEKFAFVDALSDIFQEYISEREQGQGDFAYLPKAMQRWYFGLPSYTKKTTEFYKGAGQESEKIHPSTTKLLKSIINDHKSTNEFLFVQLPEIFGETDYVQVVSKVRSAKTDLDNAKKELIKYLLVDVQSILMPNANLKMSVSSTVKDYLETLEENTLTNLFSGVEHKVLELMKAVTNDDILFLERLAKILVSLRIDDWSKNTIATFLNQFQEVKKNIENYNATIEVSHTGQYRVAFVDSDGEESVKTFAKIEYSNRAKLLYNALISDIEDMGESISEEEKRQVLMRILHEMC